MSGRNEEREAADVAAHKDALEQQQAAQEEAAEAEQTNVGYDETQPHQEEVVAGSPEHTAILNANPNASSYGPEVNVVLPPEPTEEEVAAKEEDERRRVAEQEEAERQRQEEEDPGARGEH